MNKIGESSSLIDDNLIYIVLIFIFLSIMIVFLNQQKDGARMWQDFYAKEIVKIIDSSSVGDEVTLDINKAISIAKNKGVVYKEIFTFDNKNSVCVKLSAGQATCYEYYKNFKFSEPEIRLGVPGNILKFKILKNEENEQKSR